MTATTPTLGWPYPEPSDARGAGANAVRDLALAVEADVARGRWQGHYATVALAESASAAAPAGTAVNFPGAQYLAAFTFDGVTLTYTGAQSRLFLIMGSVEVATGGNDLVTLESTVYLYTNGVVANADHQRLDSFDTAGNAGTLQRHDHTHRITHAAYLAPGDTVHFVASGNVGGQVGQCQVQVMPLAPLGW
jgi:hypothetical protein